MTDEKPKRKRMTLTQAQANVASMLKRVINDGETVNIAMRNKAEKPIAVIMPYDDYIELAELHREAQINAEASRDA